MARLRRACLQLLDDLHDKRAVAQVDAGVIRMRRRLVDRRAVPSFLQQGASDSGHKERWKKNHSHHQGADSLIESFVLGCGDSWSEFTEYLEKPEEIYLQISAAGLAQEEDLVLQRRYLIGFVVFKMKTAGFF
ncbi:hypothetical protein F2P81_002572 [Scophthalmus maximus]|uniref:Uncharacterized protein n=1 Tax=Scophthalmus maximus TaxID=52904 RepID=A0A6A4TJ57_SCOMX|nr:hypothetical protein F2P81_002572 [Scophthalmus maximus]